MVPNLAKAGMEVLVESGAGDRAGFTDSAYIDKGAKVLQSRKELFSSANVIVMVCGFSANEKNEIADFNLMKPDLVIIGFLDPLSSFAALEELASRKITAFAMELIPRITRAQSMDALSSMATIVGYKATLLAAQALPKIFPMLMTAAGTVSPAHVLVVGAGVAGLQAIATAKRLGAVVKAYDLRPEVKEQIESLGATFVELPVEAKDTSDSGGYAKEMDESFYKKQRELMTRVVSESDVVITTAVVPGKKAPILITSQMVKGMLKGSVIVDIAAERGGNCELTEAGKTVVKEGITIMGPTNIASSVPNHASQMYSKNISAFLLHIIKDGKLIDGADDDIFKSTLVTRGGEIAHPLVKKIMPVN
jgi:NAD(P) transhydrogenase subunit alpha